MTTLKQIKETIEASYRLLDEQINFSGMNLTYNLADDAEVELEELQEAMQDYINECVDVVYYTRAIAYLAENDPSLQESMGLAHEYGFTLDKINSELLATLLLQRDCMEELAELMRELENEVFN